MGEHRDERRRALLDAAREMLSEDPGRSPGINELTTRAGMTRSNFYTYFASRAELIVAVAEELMPRWIAAVTEAVTDAGGGHGGVVAYVHRTLRFVEDGDHTVLTALAAHLPEGPARDRLHLMHGEMTAPLRAAIEQSSHADPGVTTELVMAVTFKASELVEAGRPLAEVLPSVNALIDPVR